MQEFIGTLTDMLHVGDPTSEETLRDGEQRARAMLEVATMVLHAHLGREEIVKAFGEHLDAASAPDRERATLALASSPAEQFGDVLLNFLRQADPVIEHQVTASNRNAGAMVLAAATFLMERHGADHMTAKVGALVEIIRQAGAAGEEPMSAPSYVEPVMPPPEDIAAMAQLAPRAGLSVGQRIEAMGQFLRASTPAEAQADALASVMASAISLRERFGEDYAVGALRQAEGVVSEAAALDRWQPESRIAH